MVFQPCCLINTSAVLFRSSGPVTLVLNVVQDGQGSVKVLMCLILLMLPCFGGRGHFALPG